MHDFYLFCFISQSQRTLLNFPNSYGLSSFRYLGENRVPPYTTDLSENAPPFFLITLPVPLMLFKAHFSISYLQDSRISAPLSKYCTNTQ